MDDHRGDAAADEFFTDDRTTGRAGALSSLPGSFRDYVMDPADPVVAQYRGQRYDAYSIDRTAPDFIQDLLAFWRELYTEQFRGVTADGTVQPDLYPLSDMLDADPAPARAARNVLDLLDAHEQAQFRYPVDASEWRAWSNPEFVVNVVGLRLEDLPEQKAQAVFDLLKASLSADGYALVREIMSLNGYLGELIDLPTVMNDRSYFVSLFGEPGDYEPWGWQIFGHHLAVNFVSIKGRHVIAPVFMGAEPAVVDGFPGPFAHRVSLAVDLASSWTPSQRSHAVVYESVLDPDMPAGRVHPADERHLAGAFRDNRVIPYEGIVVSSLDAPQKTAVGALIADFLNLLTAPQRAATMELVDEHLDETYVTWYGPTDGSEPFYIRVQSPVILVEIDHHAGVWLTNKLPAKFHIHTTLRLPNGNDYGKAMAAQI